jgi:DNA-binding NtrC family response regulator
MVGHECLTATDPMQLEKLLDEFEPDLVLTDLMMPERNGMEVLEAVHKYDATIPVILITAYGSIENAVDAMKHNAADYLSKPVTVNELLEKVHQAVGTRIIEKATKKEAPRAPGAVDEEWRQDIVGESPAMDNVLNLIRKVARTDVNVLVYGESGTGKELITRSIHNLSSRRNEIFVPVDCANLPENLLESELFGYRKGAFTGANSDKTGLFEFAHKGTLFLDEIGEMPLSLQVKLLRVLQERKFRPIGGRELIEIDVRVVAATNRDLKQAVQEKTFRSDLYYRLNVVTIEVPPLRERHGDIPILANHFLRQFCHDYNMSIETLSPRAMECLKSYRWPGNVRELQNVVEHAAALTSGKTIDWEDLPEDVRKNCKAPAETTTKTSSPKLYEIKKEIEHEFEHDFLIDLLEKNQFNISRAAREAGCSRRTLYRMIHRNNIDLDMIANKRKSNSN